MMLRESVVPFRPGEFTPSDILARTTFHFSDPDELAKIRNVKRAMEPHVYSANGDVYHLVEDKLINLPQQAKSDSLSPTDKRRFDSAALALLQEYASPPKDETYAASVKMYLDELRKLDPIVLPADQRRSELALDLYRSIVIESLGRVRVDSTYSSNQLQTLDATLQTLAKKDFMYVLAPKIVEITIGTLKENPTHVRDEPRTIAAQDLAADKVSPTEADVIYSPKDTIVPRGEITTKGWQMLRAENNAYLKQDANIWKSRAGTAASVVILTIILASYLGKYQPRIVRNRVRGIAIAALLLSMLVLAQIAGIGSSPTYVFGDRADDRRRDDPGDRV